MRRCASSWKWRARSGWWRCARAPGSGGFRTASTRRGATGPPQLAVDRHEVAALGYAAAVDDANFHQFAELRTNLEAAYWYQAVGLLTPEDRRHLCGLVEQAEVKIQGNPPQIPHAEHRELHLSIYRRLNNPFVTGILEAYWELYEAVGLAMITEFEYLKTVWQYHRKMVDAINRNDLDLGYRALVEHADLLHRRPQPANRQHFE